MPNPCSSDIAVSPRCWLTRRPGECAFPVDGEGPATRSCCNPCPGAIYCPDHEAVMRGPPAPSLDELEAALRGAGLCS